eukprot:TRINITY_DN4545_c0_g1_i1.p1 TRINITY_DN4545_c0_g1~~TRINITY_DN4545_c0_g1_i1.p1  ORF type:complete len:448 (+),score=90.72 TRINITY_DN4545_c0_g1_i1:49-1344(+)
MGKKKDKVPAPGKFPKTKRVEKEHKGKWNVWLKTKATFDLLPGKMIEWEGTMVVAKALEKNTTITSIDFSHNNMGDDGLKYLAQVLKVNNFIKNLNVSCNGIGDGGGLSIAGALLTNRSLTDLNMLGNELTCISAQALGTALRTNLDLTKINLSWNKIGHRGAKVLAAAMEKNQLFQLDLGGQSGPLKDSPGLSDEGTQYICEAWKKWGVKGIHNNLCLWHNDIGKKGAAAIADLLHDHELIMDLNISWNSIGDDGLDKISNALIAGKTVLKNGNFAHNIIGDIGGREIAKVLELSLTTLEKINLSNNDIGDAGAEAIAKAMSKNTTLKQLDLSHNKIGPPGAAFLAEMISSNKHLMSLQLQRNHFGEDSKTLLSEAMRKSESTTRDPRSQVPTPMRVNYGATDDDNPYTDYIQKSSAPEDERERKPSTKV